MSHRRRSFLARSAGVLCGLNAPGLLGRAAAAGDGNSGETVLVVVQLSGGNDGLNCVVPFSDPAYRKVRPMLAVRPADVLKVDSETGFHPSLRGFADLLENAELAVVRGVGYPNPDRSHFVSTDVWHRAALPDGGDGRVRGPHRVAGAGPDGTGRARGGPARGRREAPGALLSAAGPAPSVRDAAAYRLRGGAAVPGTSPGAGLLAQVETAAASAAASSERVARAFDADGRAAADYPATGLADRLKLVARLIDAGLPERVYYTELAGFDTHAVQPATHPALLAELGGAVAAFFADLSARGQARRVALLAFSEFGRRVAENGSGGTDHGAAGPLFLAGPRVRAGLIGAAPSLTDLDGGDLRWHTDFRTVYAAALRDWLRVDADAVLGGRFESAAVFA